MGLFVDGEINTVDTLLKRDHNVLRLAEVESINIADKLALATDIVGEQVLILLQDETGDDWSGRMDMVVATEPLRKLHEAWALALIYEDAYLSGGNDRYSIRWQVYTRETAEAKKRLRRLGIGLCNTPLIKPQAPVVTSVSGGGPVGRIACAVATVNSSGQQSTLSSSVVIDNENGSRLSVQLDNPGRNATGWFVYAGLSGEPLTLQTNSVQELGSIWLSPATLISGSAATAGQSPDRFLSCQPRLTRG